MNKRNKTSLTALLGNMSTGQLDKMLQEELKKECPDGTTVRLILGVLENRDSTHTIEHCREVDDAWTKYQAHTKCTVPTQVRRHRLVLKVASVVLVLGILLTIVPQAAAAKGLFDRIAQWTDSFFELLVSEDQLNQNAEYSFRTDNPGLQRVYDTVVEFGITEPVVPMWLPGDYQLILHNVYADTDCKKITANFVDENKSAVIQIKVLTKSAPSSFFKDGSIIESYETNGMDFSVTYNEGQWVAVWVRENIECFVTLNCQEDDFYRMIDSIYSVED